MTNFYQPAHPFEDCRADSASIHLSAYVDAPCQIGEHTQILHFTHIMGHTVIGNHCHIGRNVTIASGVLLGDYVRVLNNAQLNSGVILENNVYCGPSAVFSSLRHIRSKTQSVSRVSPTLVRTGANIGANATVASGFTIGQHAFVEAGTVVDRNIPDFAVVVGNPLSLIGWRCACGEDLKFGDAQTLCPACGKLYLKTAKQRIQQVLPPTETLRRKEEGL